MFCMVFINTHSDIVRFLSIMHFSQIAVNVKLVFIIDLNVSLFYQQEVVIRSTWDHSGTV